MKIQQLTIHNIASIEDAVIDFEAQPLADSEVFLITGKTGAGKSTILDAICLALYADTPRLDGTKMQGDTKDGDKTVKIDDPRQLMRRSTSEASVSLTFTGSNKVRYEATWAVVRARKKSTGNIQPKEWQLKNLDTGLTLTKDREIEAEIQAAIGLDFSQFCRTTMLAQGEFTRFLNSKDDEKAEILEKITGVDIYSRIGAKVFEVTAQKKQLWEDAQRLVEGTVTFTDAEIEERQQRLSTLDERYQTTKKQGEQDVVKRDWLLKDRALDQDEQDAAAALRKAHEALQSEDFRQKEQTVSEWNATIDARMWMTEAKRAASTIAEQTQVLDTLAVTYTKLLGGQQQAVCRTKEISEEINNIDTAIAAEAEKVSVYQNAQTIVAHLNTIDAARIDIAKSEADIEAENKQLTEQLTPAYERDKTNVQSLKKAFETKESELKTIEDTIASFELPTKRTERDKAKDLMNRIATAMERINALETETRKHEATRKELAAQKAVLDEKSAKLTAMDAPIRDAKIRMEVRKEDLDKQSDTVNKFAATLRLKLRVGDVCPVCRQEIRSALPHEADLSALVDGLKKAFEKAEKEYNDLLEAKLKLEAEIKSESNIYNRDIKAFNEDRSLADAEQKAKDACKACGTDSADSTTLPLLTNKLEAATSCYNNMDGIIKEGEEQEAQAKNNRKKLEAHRKQVEEAMASIAETEKKMNECKARINTAQALAESKRTELDTAIQKASALIAGNWPQDWKASPLAFASTLTALAKEHNDRVQKRQTLSNRLDTTKANAENVQHVLTAILTAMPAWAEVVPSEDAEAENLLAMANQLSTALATAQSKMKTAQESMHTQQSRLDNFLTNQPHLSTARLEALNALTSSYVTRANDSMKAVRDDVVAKQTLFGNAQKLKAEHQTRQPLLTEDDTLDALAQRIADNEKRLTEIGEEKGAINQQLKADSEKRERMSALIEDAEAKKNVYHRWSRLNQLIGNTTGSAFRKIAQSYVLSSLIHSANGYMRSLTPRYELKVTPGTFVISLVDAYQSYVSRAASTISGGESFLVSLSLALALSDIGQQWQVDTLFIDEGFGTLSGEPLQKAVDTLRSLHSKAGRHVGIISHVEELQERIPVQIQVNQQGNNSSSKISIVPEPEQL